MKALHVVLTADRREVVAEAVRDGTLLVAVEAEIGELA